MYYRQMSLFYTLRGMGTGVCFKTLAIYLHIYNMYINPNLNYLIHFLNILLIIILVITL